jgi:hypothetical protein
MENSKPVVTVVQGKHCKLLTFYCSNCKIRHTVAIRLAGEKLPPEFTGTYWVWNGSYDLPKLDSDCVATSWSDKKHNYNCHVYLQGDGMGQGSGGYYKDNRHRADQYVFFNKYKLLPVDEWPPLVAPPPEKADKNETE